jgi:hypothetical protein
VTALGCQAVAMKRTRLVTALALVGAALGVLLLGGTASAETDSSRNSVLVNRGW